MTKTPWLAVTLTLLPLAAGAQMMGPMPVTTPYFRPAVASPPSSGITVVGASIQRVPVRDVRFIAFARGAADQQAVLDAMRGAGITDGSVTSAQGVVVGGNVAMLRGTITQVSRAKLDAIGAAAAAYVRAHPGASIDNVQLFAAASGCEEMEGKARTAALAEAHRRAEAIAAGSASRLGVVTGVDEGGGCPASGDSGNGLPVDASSLTTSVTVTETVTYAIVPPSGSLRRPL
ncbi:MAG TPA: SIMPL domain-containing protein [Candidatus Acidoferrum sp.]|nr:SIMPL domain-containing protein [Candidatus Acidoferrum sp.]